MNVKPQTANQGDAQTEAKFKFVNNGNERTWTIDILKSPDGTTGTMTVAVTADSWKAAPAPGRRPATSSSRA